MSKAASALAVLVAIIGANVVAAGVFRVLGDVVMAVGWMSGNWVVWGLVGACAVGGALAFVAGYMPACAKWLQKLG